MSAEQVGDTRLVNGGRQYLSPQGWQGCCSPPFCPQHRAIPARSVSPEPSPLERSMSLRDLAALARDEGDHQYAADLEDAALVVSW